MHELQRYFWDQDLTMRTVKIDGETWFAAKDVCDALELVNSRKAVGDLDDDEKGVTKVVTRGGKQNMQIVSESGLYSLMLKSRKPGGIKFRRWLCHDVLPAIRQTGGYHMANSDRVESRAEILRQMMAAEIAREFAAGQISLKRV